MTLDHRQHHADTLRATLSLLIYPIQVIVGLPASTGGWLAENLSSRQTLLNNNQRLHEEDLLLKIKLQKLEALEAENQRLRELLGSSFKVGEKTLIAELIAVDMAPFSQQLLLNKGSLDKVCSGQPLLDADGVMGQVLHVGPVSSTAILITDPSHAIPIEVNRNGLRAIALGIGDTNQLELPHLPNNADIQPGDLLVTSGLGGRFPAGYPVARVTTVANNPGAPFASVTAKPTAKLLSTREILLVWLQGQKNCDSPQPDPERPSP
jgi:rod shape-determining protein MreC